MLFAGYATERIRKDCEKFGTKYCTNWASEKYAQKHFITKLPAFITLSVFAI